MMLLEVKALTKYYQRDAATLTALREAWFSLREKEFACVTGPSGSGKSTLLNIIAGLLPPDSGQVFFAGREITALADEELSELRNDKIGYIPQGHSILANLTVLENVCLPFYLYKRTGDPRPRAEKLLAQTGVRHLAGQYPAQLSGGELRRVSIARGLINEPLLLIADEPAAGLDAGNAASVLELFAQAAAAGAAVLLVTHDVKTPQGTRILYMENGALTEREKV